MYVRKFESETIDGALKQIKMELGPDAIILKTITNTGLKGAFKKNKIEITAAISEKNYGKKAGVDAVLSNDEKNHFYSDNASVVSNMIDNHAKSKDIEEKVGPVGGYGNLGLNRAVREKNVEPSISNGKPSLDDFLGSFEKEEAPIINTRLTAEPARVVEEMIETKISLPLEAERKFEMPETIIQNNIDQEIFDQQKLKIDDLEKKLYELTKEFERFEKPEPQGIYHLRTTLKSFNISNLFIQGILKKCLFELSAEEIEDPDIVFDFALREMLENVKVELPLFSNTELNNKAVITIFISDMSSGQTNTIYKIAAARKDSAIVKFIEEDAKDLSFTEKTFGLNVIPVRNIPEAVAACRRMSEDGKKVFIDYKNLNKEVNEVKKFVDGLRRSFSDVEVLVSLSAIHSELYNKNVVGIYQDLADGMVLSQLDICVNYGSLFNLAEATPLPFKFFSTGTVIPDDIEPASSERIVAGIFNL